jgi:signal transduction histidine kinase
VFRNLLRSQVTFDVTVAVLAAFMAVLAGRFDAGGIVLAIGFGVALAFRRLSPGLALAIAWATAVFQMVSGQNVDVADLMLTGVLYATSAYGTHRVRWAGLVSAVGGSLVAGLYLTIKEFLARYDLAGSLIENPSQLFRETLQGIAYLVVVLALLLLPWLAGLAVRTRSVAKMSREAQLLAERDAARADRAVAVEQERVRIAREMHDIVAHSLAVVIAQADGARYALRAAPDTADEALGTISTTARRALGDVRELLGALRHEQGNAPTPDADDVDRLVADLRTVGLDVALERSGDPAALPTTTQLAVYRILQESLTNALKHGDPGARVAARLSYGAETVAIDVVSRRAADGRRGPGTGHGLVGMRERATMAGGTMTAGVRGPEFVVAVRIPSTGTGAVRMPVNRAAPPAPQDQPAQNQPAQNQPEQNQPQTMQEHHAR